MSGRRNGADLVVVGAGVVGLAVARDARARGMDVVVLDRGRAGREASWAAAGMLSPLGEASRPGPFLRFGMESLRAWAPFTAELEEESGIRLGYDEGGKLRLASSDDEEHRLRERHDWASREGLPVRWLEADDVERAEPRVRSEGLGGLLLEADYRVDNRSLSQALVASARARGVEIREGTAVRSVVEREGRARAVRLEEGGEVEAGAVLLAAGAWTGRIGGIPEPVPVRPVRGQMVSLRPETPISDRVVESEEVYLVPRDDGRLLLGATMEDVGFRVGTTAAGVRDLLGAAVRMAPSLADAPVTELWSGFRPGTPDGLPILGSHPAIEGLHLATGHFRNGILLAPVTGRVMAAVAAGDPTLGPPPEFSPGRFLAAGVHDSRAQESPR